MAQVNIEKTETPANDPDKVTLPTAPRFTPTGKQLADLARAAKCHADVFKDGAGKEAVAAIVKAAQESVPMPAPAVTTEEGKPLAADAPRFCWRCGANDWIYHPAEATRKTVRCQRCGARYVTPKF